MFVCICLRLYNIILWDGHGDGDGEHVSLFYMSTRISNKALLTNNDTSLISIIQYDKILTIIKYK